MKTAINKIVATLNFDENFIDDIESAIESELDIASNKWVVKLTDEDRENIKNHSLNQLRRKISEAARVNWDGSETLPVRINANSKHSNFSLPSKMSKTSKIRLVKLRDGWEVDQEGVDESIHVSELMDYFRNKALTWVRTAVFYGVSSFTQ